MTTSGGLDARREPARQCTDSPEPKALGFVIRIYRRGAPAGIKPAARELWTFAYLHYTGQKKWLTGYRVKFGNAHRLGPCIYGLRSGSSCSRTPLARLSDGISLLGLR